MKNRSVVKLQCYDNFFRLWCGYKLVEERIAHTQTRFSNEKWPIKK